MLMEIVGWCAIGLGAVFSAAVLYRDTRSMLASEPYAGMGRFGPELHVLGAIATGAGAGLLGGIWTGLGVGLGHVVIAFAVFFAVDRLN